MLSGSNKERTNSMWTRALLDLAQRRDGVASRLLRGDLRFQAANEALRQDLISRASAILGLRPHPRNATRHIVIHQSNAAPAEARLLLVALACAGIATRHGKAAGLLEVHGPLLFITQQITTCRGLLASIKLGGIPITDVYPVLSLGSANTAPPGPAIYLANPGRTRTIQQHRRFGAVVIDATHPRSVAHLDSLLKAAPIQSARVVIVLAPMVALFGQIGPEAVHWVWNASSASELHEALSSRRQGGRPDIEESKTRHYWLAADREIEAHLEELHNLLAGAMRLSPTSPTIDLLSSWAIYHRLRELSVPLQYAERAWRSAAYQIPLRQQIDALGDFSGSRTKDLQAYLSLYSPRIRELLEALYDLNARGNEPDKFYIVGTALEFLLAESEQPIRLVTPTEQEALILEELLADLVDGLPDALADGRLEFVHQREAARRVAEGDYRTTLLAGARTSKHRYLDIFPVRDVHLAAFSYEVDVDQRAIERSYRTVRQYTQDPYRCRALSDMGHDTTVPRAGVITTYGGAAPPAFNLHGDLTHRPPQREREDTDPFILDWEDFRQGEGLRSVSSGSQADTRVPSVLLRDVDGDSYRYPLEQLLDVYYPETEKIRRVPASSIRVGDQLIILADDQYETLFGRLSQSLDKQRPLKGTLLLERWRVAKQKLLDKYDGNRTQMYDALRADLTVEYPALVSWFREEDDSDHTDDQIMGPRSYTDYSAIAKATGLYDDEDGLRQTFSAIKTERVNRRRLGRSLHKALKSLVQGASYEDALRAARSLDTPVDDVLNAVEVREIAYVSPDGKET